MSILDKLQNLLEKEKDNISKSEKQVTDVESGREPDTGADKVGHNGYKMPKGDNPKLENGKELEYYILNLQLIYQIV